MNSRRSRRKPSRSSDPSAPSSSSGDDANPIKIPFESVSCSICFETGQAPRMSCCGLASACLDCVRQSLDISLREHMGQAPVPACPSCSRALSDRDLRAVASRAQAARYDGLLLGLQLQHQPGFHACPVSRCLGWGWLPPGEYGKVTCPSCAHHWVVQRTPTAVERALSGAFGQLGITNLRAELWKSTHTKPCPACGVRILKHGGCPHVSCRNTSSRGVSCSHEFCWYCLLPWSLHNPLLCLAWHVRYLFFWLAMLYLAWDMPLEYALSVAGFLYALVRRVNSTWRSALLDTTSDQAERNMPYYQLGRVASWAVAAGCFALYAYFPTQVRLATWLLFALLLPVLFTVLAALVTGFYPAVLAALALAWFFRGAVASIAVTLFLFPVTFLLPLLPLFMLPVGLAAALFSAFAFPKTILYSGNLFTNGLSCLRSVLVYAVLLPTYDASFGFAYLSSVSSCLAALADLLGLLDDFLRPHADFFANPLHVIAAGGVAVLVLVVACLCLTELAGQSRPVLALSYLILSAAVIFSLYQLDLPHHTPSPAALPYRHLILTPWDNLISKTLPIFEQYNWNTTF